MKLRNTEFREIRKLEDPGGLCSRLCVRENPPKAETLKQAQGSRKSVSRGISGKQLPHYKPASPEAA